MKRATNIDAFLADPRDSWILAGQSVVWCSSDCLGGSATWGKPDAQATRDILRAFEGVFSDRMAAQVDVVLDARRVEAVPPDSLEVLLGWLFKNKEALAKRVRVQIGIIPSGMNGMTLAGILPTVGETHPFRVERDPLEPLRAVAGESGERLSAEIDALVESVSGLSPELAALRELLRERHATLTVEEAAKVLKVSTRSLQRVLQSHGTSFQDELRTARFEHASELLRSTDDKIAAIAMRVGVTEGALTQLFRDRAGCTPSEYRKNRDG